MNDDEIQSVNSILEALCTDISNHVLSTIDEELDVYYTNIGNTFELHLEDNIYLNLTEEQEEIKGVVEEFDLDVQKPTENDLKENNKEYEVINKKGDDSFAR